MKIQMSLDQKAMNKSRKFVYFMTDKSKTEFMTIKQAETVYSNLIRLDIPVDNQTGLNFN